MKNYPENPLIVLGMHRSGTSLLSQILDSMGVYTGYKKEGNNESKFYLKINNWLLNQAGCDWASNSLCIDSAFAEVKFKQFLINHVNYRLNSIENFEYKGFNRKLEKGQIWGWKDPRNTLTYEIWNEIYPNNKVIAIRRHGLDVAMSLHKRSNDWMDKSLQLGVKGSHNAKLRLFGYSDSYKSLNISSALKVWENYEDKVESLSGTNNILQVKYEDILLNTDALLDEIQEFLGASISKSDRNKIISQIVPDRAYAHRKNSALQHYIVSNQECFNKFGYYES